jgi:hypothetical protein
VSTTESTIDSHNRKIDTDISGWTLVLDVTGQKRNSRHDIWPIGGRASVSKPTDKGKSEQHDNKDLRKVIMAHSAFLDAKISAPERSLCRVCFRLSQQDAADQ